MALIVGIVSSSAIVLVICLFGICLIVRRRRNAKSKQTDIFHQSWVLDGDEDDDRTSIVTVTVPGSETVAMWALSDDTVPTKIWNGNLTSPSAHFTQSTHDVL
jgi:hypothetical protein